MIDELNDQLDEIASGVSVTGGNGLGDSDGLLFSIGEDTFGLDLYRRVSVTPPTAFRLVQEHPHPGFVVGDIIHRDAAEVLIRHGWSFWDRRGRLRLWLPDHGVRLDVNRLRSFATGEAGPDHANPVVGAGAIAVAVALLTAEDPTTISVREIARAAGMNASTISRARTKLIDAALIEPDGSPLPNELFWATSRAWRPKTIPVDSAPSDEGWVLSGDDAAAHHGAAVLAGHGRWYTIDPNTLRRYALRHRSEHGREEIALAPTPLVVTTALDGIAHPVVAALDLSTTSRGGEILTAWTTPPIGKPVWR